jgi:hypothetical protein
VDLPPDGGADSKVLLARARHAPVNCWLLVGPTVQTFNSTVWASSTTDAWLAEAAIATYEACAAGKALHSPWRWSEPERSEMVEAAEMLEAVGHDVTAVASRNRMVPHAAEGLDEPVFVPGTFGDALRIQLDWGQAVLARKPSLGWVLDVADEATTRRLDLASFATGHPSPAPGWHTGSVAQAAEAAAARIASGPWDPAEARVGNGEIYPSDHPLHHAVAWWMRELGYAETYAMDYEPKVVSNLEVAVCTRETSVDLRDVKTAFASAVVDGRKLVMFSVAGFTRGAQRWADRADIALFNVSVDGSHLSAASRLAQEHMPTVI